MRKLISVLCATLVALAGAASVSAQTATEANVTVTGGGELVVSIGAADFADVPYDFAAQTTNADIVVHVEDNTGTASGWNVTILGDAVFTSADTTSTIPIGNLTMATGTPVSVEGQDVTDITAPGAASGVTTTAQPIASAPAESGQGVYDITYPSSLVVPGGTQVGEYNATLTVSITSGP